MEYKSGTIVWVTRTVFADNGRFDNRSGHPSVLPIASNDYTDETYYLMLTSNVSRILVHPDQYYDLTAIYKEVHLRVPSLINLQTIYKGHVDGQVLGGIMPKKHKEVLAALKAYQEEHPCELYEEIKERI